MNSTVASVRDRSREPATTSDYLDFHARHRPSAVAVINGTRSITYAEFNRDLVRFSRALNDFGLPAGTTVAVGFPDLYVHWLLLLAAEDLGLVTASFVTAEGELLVPLLKHADLVLCESDLPLQGMKRFHKLAPEWVAGVLQRRLGDDAVQERRFGLRPDHPQRIRRSSGTTGGPKMMPSSRLAEENRVRQLSETIGFSRQTRFLCANQFSVGLVYSRATLCLRLGATCLSSVGQPFGPQGCTDTWMQPLYLEQTLNELPKGFVKPPVLRMETAGAVLPRGLRERALRELASEVTNDYGSNEAGPTCAIGLDGVGTVFPGVKVEVVDERDEAVPPGSVGNVRVKSQSMVDGYIGNPEANAQMFRHGWFYPGDAGVMVGPRRLRIVGRRDEILNVGGLKLAPETVEELLKKTDGVVDVAVALIDQPADRQEICIVYVGAPWSIAESIERAFRAAILIPNVKISIKAIDRVPRTDSGKIRRHAVKAAFGGTDAAFGR